MFHAISGIVLSGADKVMLGRLTTSSEVGLYGFAGTVLALLNTFTVSLYTSWRPFVFEKLKEGNINATRGGELEILERVEFDSLF